MLKVNADAFIRDLRQLEADVRALAHQGLGQAAAFALALVRQTTKIKDHTGGWRGSLKRGQRGPQSWFVQAGDRRIRYAAVLEDGSRAHVIQARNGGVLRFVQNGQVRFARRVNHPGTKPTHVMLDARNAAEVQLGRFVESGFNQLFR